MADYCDMTMLQVYADATVVFPLIVSQTFAKGYTPPTTRPEAI
jgi:deoxyhypusine synthase